MGRAHVDGVHTAANVSVRVAVADATIGARDIDTR